MKKTIGILFFLLVITSPILLGQQQSYGKHHIRVGIGADIMMTSVVYDYLEPCNQRKEGWGEDYYQSKNELEYYTPFPTYKVEYTYNVSRKWELGGNINYGYAQRRSKWNFPGNQRVYENNNIVGIMGTARWIWFRSSIIRIGSSAGIGVTYLSSRRHLTDGESKQNIALPLFQLNIFNLSIGRKSSVFMDIYGTNMSIGYEYQF